MPTLRELQEQRAGLVAGARERLDQINANTDEARAAELTTQHDAAMAELDRLDASIARTERVERAELEENERRERDMRNRRPINPVGQTGAGAGNGEITYRDAFHAYMRAQGQVALMSGEERAILQGGYQSFTADEQRAQTTATGAAGGYTVPVELQAEIIKAMVMWGPMYDPGVTREIVTGGGYQMPYPTVDDTGNTANAQPEGQALADDGSGDVVFGQRALGAFSMATPWIRVSKELADDSVFNMESLIGDLLGERLGRGANARLTNGTGAAQPTGIVTASPVGITSASANAFAFDDVIGLEHSVDPAYRASPKVGYMLNDAILKVVRTLKDGQGNYLWQAGDVQKGVPAMLNGRRFIINQAMAAATTTGQKVMLFGDFGKYFVRKVGAPLVGALQDKDFWPGFGMAGWIRFDGNLMDQKAVKALKLA